jgi:acylphosphatase
MKRRVRLQIAGVVQGVSYRWSMQHEARRLGVSGWVRNRRDGSVEAVAEAEERALHQLLAWSHDGPPGAVVSRVEAEWSEATGEFVGGFEIRH